MSSSSHCQQVWSQLGTRCSLEAELVLWIFLELIFLVMVSSFCFRTQGNIFPWGFFLGGVGFFLTTAQWVISNSLFYQFWLLHSTTVITELHVASNLQSMLGYCISNSKEDTSWGRAVLDIPNLKGRPPDSHFSFLRSAILSSQSSHHWPTIKVLLISLCELPFFFTSPPQIPRISSVLSPLFIPLL